MAQVQMPRENRPMYTLYTYPECVEAERVHIVLAELKIPFKQVIVDPTKPNQGWYLSINPRGMIPSLTLPPNPFPAPPPPTILQSEIITLFLAEAHPRASFLPSLTSPQEAWARAKIFSFIFCYKWHHHTAEIATELKGEDQTRKLYEFVAAIKKEVEPLLIEGGNGPFLRGKELGYAEAVLGPCLLRLQLYIKNGLVPKDFNKQLEQDVPRFRMWKDAVCQHPSVTVVWNEKSVLKLVQQQIARRKGSNN